MNELYLNESQILSTIEKVLAENRKVLKVGNGGGQMPQSQVPPMPADNGMMGGGSNAMAPQPIDNMQPDSMGSVPPMDGEEQDGSNQFDTNFDAGVEADEDSDPKHYIQQLTGKLSQSLNSFNGEQGGDAGLSKYVASMIISAACKNLDEKAKKELIEKIKSASSDEMDDSGEEEMGDEPMDGEDMGGEEMPPVDNQEMPVNEMVFTKKAMLKEMKISELMNLTSDFGKEEERPKEINPGLKKKMPHAWTSKF